MDELPDIFGPFSKGMTKLHTEVVAKLKENSKYFSTNIKVDLLQCTFNEYIDMDHDRGYTWYQLNIDEDPNRKVSIGFNDTFYKGSKDELEMIIQTINNTWNHNKLGVIKKTQEIKGTKDLKRHADEMIQSVHFIKDDESTKDGNHQLQLFKIIYTYSSLKPILERLRNFG